MNCWYSFIGRAADLQLIRLLKAGVVEQAREIRENRKELLFTEASLDAVSHLTQNTIFRSIGNLVVNILPICVGVA